MMTALRNWLTAVMATAMLLSVAEKLIPAGTMRKAASLTGGLILLLVLVRPLTGLDIRLPELDISSQSRTIEERRRELESENTETLAALIAERTAAYISDKAETLGLGPCDVRVTTVERDGVPCPDGAELSCPPSEPLAAYMEEELGIARERQVFHGTG